MIFTFYQIAAFFFIYSFIGWCVEVAYQGVSNGKLVNRGFLNGPVCPIYGVGMVGVLLVLKPLEDNLLILFIGGILITTAIELFGGWILDKIFHMRWWDYSDKPFNLRGYICLEFSLIWGMGVVGVVRLVHPAIENLVNKFPRLLGIILLIVSAIIMLIDIIVTYKTVIGITRSLGEMEKMAENLREISDALTQKVGTTAIVATEIAEGSKEKVTEAVEESKEKMSEMIAESREAVAESREKITEAIAESREAMAESKEKMSEMIAESREKVSDAFEDGREKLTEAVERGKLKLENAQKRLELEEQKAELEEKYKKLTEKMQKNTKRFANAFPKWHLSNERKSFMEHIKNIRK